MKLMLSSTGNPDHLQNPNEKLFGCEADHMIAVHSFADASKKCRDFIQRNELGSGNWSGGKIFDNDGICIGKVSYNGRVWNSEQQTIFSPSD